MQSKPVIILQPRVQWIDPHINTDDKNTLSPLMNVFEALVKTHPQGGFQGCLAERWQVSDDAREWTFFLRKQVRFHSAQILTAQDVITSLKRMINPEVEGYLGTKGIYYHYLGSASITAADDLTMRLVLPYPMADLLDFLVKFPIAPHTCLHDPAARSIGTGPYRITHITEGRIEMRAFEHYWGEQPAFDTLIWFAEPDQTHRVEALLSGSADIISDLTPESAASVRGAKNACLASIESSLCTVFMCNHIRGVCTDRRVRQALNYGLDKDELIRQVMKGAARPINGPLTALHFGYNPEVPVYPHDPEKARALLAEAGYPDGMDLVLDVPTIIPDEAVALAEHMAEQYRRIGVRTVIKTFTDRTAYAEMVRAKQIDDACCFDSSPQSTYQVLSDKFHSGQHGPWWQGYQNREVDSLIDQAQATVDDTRRKEIYQQAYRLLHEDAPWIFLHNPILMWGLSPAVQGWKPNREGLIRLG